MPLDPQLAERVAHLWDATVLQLLSGEVEGPRPGPRLAVPGVSTEDVEAPVRARIYRRAGDSGSGAPALVWAHGGGWQYGDLEMPEADSVAQVVATAGIVVVSVDYRLAPAHRHPAALDDVLAAHRWVASGGVPGVDPGRVALGGASAGGHLAATAALRLGDADQGSAALWLAYPVVDPAGGPYEDRHPDCPPVLWLGREGTMGLFAGYLGTDPEAADPAVVPARGHLDRLPPTLVTTAECDSLRAQGAAFVAALRDAGVAVTHHHVASVLHGYLNTVGDSALADAALARHVEWLHDGLRDGFPRS